MSESGGVTVDLSRGMLPALKVVGICTFVFAVAWWARGLQITVEQTAYEVAAIRQNLDRTQDDHAGKIRDLERRMMDAEREHRLLKDYVEGRISRLPYRPTGAPP